MESFAIATEAKFNNCEEPFSDKMVCSIQRLLKSQLLLGGDHGNSPDNRCVFATSDKLFRTMADLVVSEGYAAVGYEYINIDDCWLEKERNFRGELQPDKQRFPYGLRDLSNFECQPTQQMPHVARPAAPHSHDSERILLRIDGV
uniref:Alpha-galactosidase n=1 Tax=Timema poppense TaxID=170557 RepID=A0A7R9CSG7_TIMPO|nr:unnamed protein product [Timema poppensis]